jgi:hypothetical protein
MQEWNSESIHKYHSGSGVRLLQNKTMVPLSMKKYNKFPHSRGGDKALSLKNPKLISKKNLHPGSGSAFRICGSESWRQSKIEEDICVFGFKHWLYKRSLIDYLVICTGGRPLLGSFRPAWTSATSGTLSCRASSTAWTSSSSCSSSEVRGVLA